MAKEEKIEDIKVKEATAEVVTVDKSAFDSLLKRVEEMENKPKATTEGYPLKVTKPEFRNKENGQQYTSEQVQYFQHMSYYEGYPQIRSGRVEDSGKLYELDETYKPMYKGNAPMCMCGAVHDLDTLKKTSVLFVPHRGVWICQSANCEQQYNRRYGGFERLVARHLFARDTPYYGMILPDKNDPCIRRGIYPDVRQNEFNF